MRRVRLILLEDDINYHPSETATTLVEGEAKFFCLLDAQGNPILRRSAKVPMGFHVKPK